MPEFVDVGLPTRIEAAPPDPANPPQMPDDGYPGVFKDQRQMLPGGLEAQDATDILRCWEAHLAQHQKMIPRLDEENRTVVPYLNAGRWIADCPACGCGMACWDRNPQACCLGWKCGRIYQVAWQPPQERSAVMRVVAGWPEGNRNWDAHKGETLEELRIQGVLLAGVSAAQRNGLLVSENLTVPDEFIDSAEYLDKLRRDRRKDV